MSVSNEMSSYLPEDLIFNDIFPKLPTKSLNRFQCVSKHSRFLLSYKPFLDAFRRQVVGRYVISFQNALDKNTVFYFSDPEHQPKIADNPTLYTYIKFINGLICTVERCGAITIRNPAAKVYPFRLPQLRSMNDPTRKHHIYFCHDPATNRYKVLQATCVGTRAANGEFTVLQTEFSIMTLGADRDWRVLTTDPDMNMYQLGNSKSVCIKGALFCTNFSTSTSNEDGAIFAFEVARERFNMVEYPDGLLKLRYSSCYVIEVGGSIAVVDGDDIRSSGIIKLWKMRGFNMSEPWEEHRIEIPAALQVQFNLCPTLSVSNNGDGEMVVAMAGMSTNQCHVYCHCVETGKWRRIVMVGMQHQHHSIFGHFQIDEYVENPKILPEILGMRRILIIPN